MTSHKCASGFRDDWLQATNRAILYQAIKRYEFKDFLRDATDRGLLSEEETREIDPQSGRRRSRREMREHMLMLMLDGTERQQRFVQFVDNYATKVKQRTVSALLPFTKVTEFQSAEGQQQLSQESFSSDEASPMELDTTDNSDVGYYTADTISSNTSPFTDHRESMTSRSTTDVDYLRRNLEVVHKSRHSFQKYTAMKKQDSMSQQLPQSLSGVPLTSTTTHQISATNVHVTNNQFFFPADSNNYYRLYREGGGRMVQIPKLTSAQSGGHHCSRTASDDSTFDNKSWSARGKWRSVDKHFPKIIYTLNVKQLMPLLIEKGLLTPSEREEIDKLQGLQHDQNKHLLQILPRKGEKSYELFLQCLREEEEHMGHQDIVKWLGLSSQEAIEV